MFKKILIFLSIMLLISLTGSIYAADNNMKIDLFGGFGSVSGEITDTEHDLSKITVTYDDGDTETGKPTHIDYHCGIFSDKKLSESHGGTIQYSIRGMYSYNIIEQQIRTSHINYDEILLEETMIKYHAVTAGPVLTFIPGADTSIVNRSNIDAYINFFVLTGPVFCGSLTPAPIVRESNSGLDAMQKTDFYGIQLNAGLGFGAFIGSVDFGFNLYFCGNWIKTEKKVYPSVDKQTFFDHARVDIYAGLHL